MKSSPRVVGRQRHRSNAPAATPEEHCRRNMWFPLIDGLGMQLTERFPPSAPVVTLQKLIPSMVHRLDSDEMVALAAQYEADLPSISCLRGELHCWSVRWERLPPEERPVSAIVELEAARGLPNTAALLQLLCTLPITACEAERTFSALKRVKSENRATMGEERTEGLLLLHVHPTVRVTKQQVVDRFLQCGKRRVIR